MMVRWSFGNVLDKMLKEVAMGQHHVIAMVEGGGRHVPDHAMKHKEGEEIQHYSLLTTALVEISGQLHTETTLHPGKKPNTH